MSIIDLLTEIKRNNILEECRASYYCDEYSIPFATAHAGRYRTGLQDGIELINRRVVKKLLSDPSYSLKKIASVVGCSMKTVRAIKMELQER